MFSDAFNIFSFLFIAVGAIAVSIIAAVLFMNLRTWLRNNRSPILTVNAVVESKRTKISHWHIANAGDITGAHGYSTGSSTRYYVTFRTEEGARIELDVDEIAYASLKEGDAGKLTSQGTRYLGFERL